MLFTCWRNKNSRTILESNVIHSRKTSYEKWALKSTINIVTNIWMVEWGRNTTNQKSEEPEIHSQVEATDINAEKEKN